MYFQGVRRWWLPATELCGCRSWGGSEPRARVGVGQALERQEGWPGHEVNGVSLAEPALWPGPSAWGAACRELVRHLWQQRPRPPGFPTLPTLQPSLSLSPRDRAVP